MEQIGGFLGLRRCSRRGCKAGEMGVHIANPQSCCRKRAIRSDVASQGFHANDVHGMHASVTDALTEVAMAAAQWAKGCAWKDDLGIARRFGWVVPRSVL